MTLASRPLNQRKLVLRLDRASLQVNSVLVT
jgi:hypothetical protein